MQFLVTVISFVFLSVAGLYAELDLNTIMQNQPGTQIRQVKFLDDNFGVAVGFFVASSSDYTGILATTQNGGQDWEFGTLAGALFFGVDINANREISVAGFHLSNAAIILRSRDMGATWTNLLLNGGNRPDVTSLYHIEYLDDMTMLAAGFDGSILHSTDNGTSWSHQHSDDDWSIWNVRHHNDVHIACGLASIDDELEYRLYKSEDNGLNWYTLDVNIPDGLGIEAVEFTGDGNLFGFGIIDEKYAVARSTNQGVDWNLVYNSDAQGTLKCAHINAEGHVFGAGSDGKIVYNLSGDTWQEIHTAGDAFIWDISSRGQSVLFTSSSGRIYENKGTATSIEDAATNAHNAIVVFHDPSQRSLQVTGLEPHQSYTLRLSSINGRNQDFSIPAGGHINLAALANGAYVYMILQNNCSDCPAGGKQLRTGKLIQL